MPSITPSVTHPFVGMKIQDALAASVAAGSQVRILTNHDTAFHYAEDPAPGHVLVRVRDGVVTSARVA